MKNIEDVPLDISTFKVINKQDIANIPQNSIPDKINKSIYKSVKTNDPLVQIDLEETLKIEE